MPCYGFAGSKRKEGLVYSKNIEKSEAQPAPNELGKPRRSGRKKGGGPLLRYWLEKKRKDEIELTT